jgi:hypothetical protein
VHAGAAHVALAHFRIRHAYLLAHAHLPEPSGIVAIMVVVLAMFSPVQAIIAAEAGVNAGAENMAAVIKNLHQYLLRE